MQKALTPSIFNRDALHFIYIVYFPLLISSLLSDTYYLSLSKEHNTAAEVPYIISSLCVFVFVDPNSCFKGR